MKRFFGQIEKRFVLRTIPMVETTHGFSENSHTIEASPSINDGLFFSLPYRFLRCSLSSRSLYQRKYRMIQAAGVRSLYQRKHRIQAAGVLPVGPHACERGGACKRPAQARAAGTRAQPAWPGERRGTRA